jgi:hypothetical protein
MRVGLSVGVAAVVAGVGLGVVVCLAQTASAPAGTGASGTQQRCTYTDESGKVVTLPNCGANAAPGSNVPAGSSLPASKQFPFPGEAPDAPTAPAAQTTGAAPAANAAPAADTSQPASKRFPFPGETPEAPAAASPAAPGAGVPGLQDAGSEGAATDRGDSSSSSSSSSSSAGYAAAPAGNDEEPTATPRGPRRRVPVTAVQTPAEREEEDVRVAAFYQNDGDFRGAYARGVDAVGIDDSDPEAHLALAEAARRLGKLDEAEKNYRRCLELDPLPKDRKVAETALKEMTGK